MVQGGKNLMTPLHKIKTQNLGSRNTDELSFNQNADETKIMHCQGILHQFIILLF